MILINFLFTCFSYYFIYKQILTNFGCKKLEKTLIKCFVQIL